MIGKALSFGRSGVPGQDLVREQMRRGRVLAVLVGAVAVWGAAALAAASAANAGAVSAVSGPVPAATSFAEVSSVSCASPGNCAGGGSYEGLHGQQGFVADERNGRWGSSIAVPGLAALRKGGDASVWSVSCASAGDCAAGGSYFSEHPLGDQGFVADRAERPLAHGDRGARPGGPEQGRGRRGQLGVVRLGGQLRGRRVLREPRSAGVRGRRAERPLAHGDRGARPGGPEQDRERPG